MKNLKGMKNKISSFENNKLSNLQSVVGGREIVRSVMTACGNGCSDRRDYYDDKTSRLCTFNF